MTVRTSASTKREGPVWVGDRTYLQRVIDTVDDAGQRRLATLLAAYDEETDSLVQAERMETLERYAGNAYAEDDANEAAERRRGYRLSGRRDLEQDWQPVLTFTEKEDDYRLTGPPGEALDRIDAKRLDTLSVRCSGRFQGQDFAAVTFGTKSGWTVRVESPDVAWLTQTKGLLIAEVNRGIPWWWWIRHPVGYLIISVSVYATVLALALIAMSSMRIEVLMVYALLPLWAFQYALKRFVPGFQYLAQGEKPRGLVAIGVLGTVVMTIVTGILVNKVS